jgi:hypothetical protein
MRKATTLIVSMCLLGFLLFVWGESRGEVAAEGESESASREGTVAQDAMMNEPLAKELVPEALRDKTATVCKKCGRHVKPTDTSCPICEASGDFKRKRDFYPEFFRPWKWSLLVKGDEVWATGWGGISVYSIKEMKEVRRITVDDGLHSEFLGFAGICQDEDENIWVSGGGIPELGIFGLSKWDGKKWIPHTTDNTGLNSRNIGTYRVVASWDSVWSGGPLTGLLRIRPGWTKKTEGDPWRRYWAGNFDLIPCDNVMAIVVDRDDPTNLWLAMYDQPEGGDIGGKWRRPVEGVAPWKKGDKIEAPGGLARWGCRWGREIGFWNPENSECPTGRGLAVAEDSKGRVWYAGDEPSKGIGYLDKKTGEWTIYGGEKGCPIKTAWGIVVDEKDNVWFTHGRDPIYRFDGKEWTAFVPEFPERGKAGVPGGDALRILKDGNLVVSTEYGLLLYEAATRTWKAFEDLPYRWQK